MIIKNYWKRIKMAQVEQMNPSALGEDMPILQQKGPYHLKPKSRAKMPPRFKMPSSTDTADEIVSRIDSINKNIDSEKSSLSKEVQMNPQFENIYNSLLGNFESFANLLSKARTDLVRNFSTTSTDFDKKIRGFEQQRREEDIRKQQVGEMEAEKGQELEEEFENLTPEQKEERLQSQMQQQEEYRKKYPGKKFTPYEGSPEYKEFIRSLSPERKFPPEMEKLRSLHEMKKRNIPQVGTEEALSGMGKTKKEREEEAKRYLEGLGTAASILINSLIKTANYLDENNIIKTADRMDNLANEILELMFWMKK